MSQIVLARGLVISAALLGGGPWFHCHAETVVSCYSEFAGVCGAGSAADGELSGEHLSPTDLGVFSAGPDVANAFLHRVVGSVEDIGNPINFNPNDPLDSAMNGTADIFTFEIPDGAQLNAIYLTEFVSSSDAIFMGLDDGPTYEFSALELNEQTADLTQTLGFTLAGTADLPDGSIPGDRGRNLLERIRDAGANNGSPFTVPLGAGQYSMYLQETSLSPSRYDLSFSVSAVTAIPEPSSAAAILMFAAASTFRRRRREGTFKKMFRLGDSNGLCKQSTTRRSLAALPLALGLLITIAGNVNGQDAATTTTKSADTTQDYLELTSGAITLSIDPSMAGRIASMTYDGQEILKTTRDENHWHWGSTIWVAPQSDWRWPPSAIIDSDPYKVVSADDSKIVVKSKIDPKTGFQITKRFEFKTRAKQPIAKMTYTVHNRSEETKKVALWENTRVVWDGVTRFPLGTKIRLAKEDQPIVMKENKNAIAIVFNDRQPNSQKVFCTPPVPADDKMTWNSFQIGDLMLTKSRKDPEQVAPGQSPLEIYFGKDAGFAELEFQGSYQTLAPGENATMVVFWRLRKVKPK